jgi:hypothetical protein
MPYFILRYEFRKLLPILRGRVPFKFHKEKSISEEFVPRPRYNLLLPDNMSET